MDRRHSARAVASLFAAYAGQADRWHHRADLTVPHRPLSRADGGRYLRRAGPAFAGIQDRRGPADVGAAAGCQPARRARQLKQFQRLGELGLVMLPMFTVPPLAAAAILSPAIMHLWIGPLIAPYAFWMGLSFLIPIARNISCSAT